MFTRLFRWVVVCSVLFCISGNVSANDSTLAISTTLPRLLADGYMLVGNTGSDGQVLLQKHNKMYLCSLIETVNSHAYGKSYCVPVR